MEMSRLTRYGTAEPISRDQIRRHAWGQGKIIFPIQLTTSRIGNLTRLIHTLLYVMTIHTLSTCTAFHYALSALRFPCLCACERERESVLINLHIVCVFIKLHMPHTPAMPFKLFYATDSGPPKGGSMI